MITNFSLSEEQLAETLRRHDVAPGTAVLGIRYEPMPGESKPRVTVALSGRQLIVPDEVLEMAPTPRERSIRTSSLRP